MGDGIPDKLYLLSRTEAIAQDRSRGRIVDVLQQNNVIFHRILDKELVKLGAEPTFDLPFGV